MYFHSFGIAGLWGKFTLMFFEKHQTVSQGKPSVLLVFLQCMRISVLLHPYFSLSECQSSEYKVVYLYGFNWHSCKYDAGHLFLYQLAIFISL